MKRSALSFLVVLAVSAPAFAQPLSFGKPFPLTNTRYASVGGTPRLAANGRGEVFLFFWSEQRIRVARFTRGTSRVGRAVVETRMSNDGNFHAVWTGAHFLVVAPGGDPANPRIVGRLVDSEGVPQGEQFTIVEGRHAPYVAFNGRHALLVYAKALGTEMVLLTPDGRVVSDPRPLNDGFASMAVASNGDGFAVLVSSNGDVRLTLVDAQGLIVTTTTVGQGHLVALTSDGRRYLGVWRSAADELVANLLTMNGTVSRALVVDAQDPAPDETVIGAPSAVWNGSSWVVLYPELGAREQALRTARLDSALAGVVERDSTGEYTVHPSLLAVGARVVIARTARLANDKVGSTISSQSPILVGELPFMTGAEETSFAPVHQTLLATTSAADATLVVWKESGDGKDAVYTGLRTRDGRWTERQLTSFGTRAIAGSDGREFIVAVEGRPGHTIHRIDPDGLTVGPPQTVMDFYPTAVAWNGRQYAFTDPYRGVRVLTPGGMLSAASTPYGHAVEASIASDGRGFFVTWTNAAPYFCTCPPSPQSVAGQRLSSDVGPESAATTFSESFPINPTVVWDGRQYVVAWGGDSLSATRIPAQQNTAPVVQTLETTPVAELTATAVAGGTALLWTPGNVWEPRGPSRHAAFLFADGSVSSSVVVDRNVETTAAPRLVALPDDSLGYVYSSYQNAEPHHGTSHIMMRIATDAPPPAEPDAPRLTGRTRDKSSFVLSWTPPAQRVTGYRVEYRVAGGTWNEFDAFLPAEQLEYVYFTWRPLAISFRVRAFNEGGPGAYSDAITLNPPRRRAVR